MSGWRAIVAAAAIAVLSSAAFATAAGGRAPAPNPCAAAPVTAILGATASRVGLVDLHFVGALGQPVTFLECVGGAGRRLGELTSPEQQTNFYSATTWRCGRLVRHFAATAKLPDGTVVRGVSAVRTISCANRFDLAVSRTVAKGRQARVRIVDRWGIGGVRTKLCVTSPRARRNCRTVVLARAPAVLRFRATTRGRWRVELSAPGARVRGTVAVGVRPLAPRRALPTILATGDSTMQGIDSFLGDDLSGEANVVSDVRPGFAISKAGGWGAVARVQTTRLRPKAAVVSIGANEGWPMVAGDGVEHACCDEAWVAEYARRVRTTMQTYLRQGRSRVVWLTLPAPRDAVRVPVFAAVNTAILRGSQGLTGLRILRLDLLFTPSGFREVMPHEGRNVRVRSGDGIHLSIAGSRIAAQAVLAALREP